jgi:KDO2-lipid IV(A) lauroyltransferase
MATIKTIRRKIRYGVVYRFVQFLIFISNIVPRIPWLKFCGLMGRIGYTLARNSRKRVIQHLTLAFGSEKSEADIRTLSRRVFTMLGMNTGEVLRASRVKTLPELQKFLITEGYENFEQALAKGKGVIFVACHLGAFDLQVTNIAIRGHNPGVVGTPLKDPRLNELLSNFRSMHGAIAIERGKETFRLIKLLKSGGVVALLIDQDTKVKSRFVEFFSRPAATPVGAAILAMKTGAALVPTYNYLGADWKQHMQIFPELPVRITGDEEGDVIHNTQVATNFIEDAIRRHPEQWVWMHERWKTRPGEEIK